MFTASPLPNGVQLRSALTVAQVVHTWRKDAAPWVDVLRATPFDACFWELPALTASRLDRPFECVLLDSPALAAAVPDSRAFAEHWTDAPTATFTNLGGDAGLVAPTPTPAPGRAYPHLLAFHRLAPDDAVQALWAAVAAAVDDRVTGRAAPMWLTTSGLGVPWLHVRLDDRPKYVQHAPYRRWP
ncbi:MAG: hypothetical protein ACI9K2_006074 [Myxococcota bacterium]|jgi:hypothetical protein